MVLSMTKTNVNFDEDGDVAREAQTWKPKITGWLNRVGLEPNQFEQIFD